MTEDVISKEAIKKAISSPSFKKKKKEKKKIQKKKSHATSQAYGEQTTSLFYSLRMYHSQCLLSTEAERERDRERERERDRERDCLF